MYQLSRSDTASSACAGAIHTARSKATKQPNAPLLHRLVVTLLAMTPVSIRCMTFPLCCGSGEAEFTSPVSLRGVPRDYQSLQQLHSEIDCEADCTQHHHGREHHLRVEIAVVLQQQVA